MSITDPIADMATLIRNASAAGKENIDIKASKVNETILEVLKKEKFIQTFKKIEDNKQGTLRAYLMHGDGSSGRNPRITNIKRISKPGLKVYKSKDEILPVLGGLGIAVVSTSHGIITDEEAREKKIGGEIMMEVW